MANTFNYISYPHRRIFKYFNRSSPSNVLSYQNVSVDTRIGTEQVTRVLSPNWRVKKAKRQDASNPYFRQDISFNFPVNNARTLSGNVESYGFIVWDGNYSTTSTQPRTDAVVADQALASLKRKLKLRVGDFNAMVPLAEVRELRSVISQSAKLTEDFLKKVIDIKRTKGRSAIKYASDAWLTYGFGIAPTIGDTKAICNSILEYLTRADSTGKLTATAKKQWVTRYNGSGIASAYGASCTSSIVMNHTVSYKYTLGYQLFVKSANNYGIADHLHLELPALVPTFWELVPYSWIVDYFTTVGAFLDDVFVSDNSKVIYLTESRKYTLDANITYGWTPVSSGDIILSSTTRPGSLQVYEFERKVLTTLPVSKLRLRTVDEMGLHGINKILNLASLLGGRLR